MRREERQKECIGSRSSGTPEQEEQCIRGFEGYVFLEIGRILAKGREADNALQRRAVLMRALSEIDERNESRGPNNDQHSSAV